MSELAGLLLQVEASYRFPQDIEWGFADGRLHLLQSRPITTIPPRWTRDESAERFPNVITPLTWDFVESGFHRSLNYSFRLMGFPPFNGKWFGMHDHYIYGNQNAVELYGRRAPFVVRNTRRAARAASLGSARNTAGCRSCPSPGCATWTNTSSPSASSWPSRSSPKSLPEVWAFVLKVNEYGADYFLPNIAISITHGTLFRLLHLLLKMGCGTGGRGHVRPAHGLLRDPDRDDQQGTVRVGRSGPGQSRTRTGASSLRNLAHSSSKRRLARFPEFEARFTKFLRDHGHREVDFDAYSPTWIEIPWVVLDNVRLILQNPMDQPPAAKERDLKIRMQQAELELFQKLPPDLHFFFAEVLRLARTYTSLDDLEHYQTTRLTPALRRGLREMGQRLQQQSILDEPMDIFFAHLQQINDATSRDTPAAWQEFAASCARPKSGLPA